MNGEVVLDVKKILPVAGYDDFYVNVISKDKVINREKRTFSRRNLPKIDTLLEWEIVKKGDIIVAKGTNEEAELQSDGKVKVGSENMSLQQWLKSVYDWSSVQTYAFAVHKEKNKTLSELRSEYMKNIETEEID